jgi:hypothetical protein
MKARPLRSPLPFAVLALAAAAGGCATPPYANRDPLIIGGHHQEARRQALEDLRAAGQFDRGGRIEGIVTTPTAVFDTKYFHQAEQAQQLIVRAYGDLAQVALDTHRYVDAVRSAKQAVEQGRVYFADDTWTLHRLSHLIRNQKILHQAYLYLGDVEQAARHYRQFLILYGVANSKSFKQLTADITRLRMTSIQLQADYRGARARATFSQLLAIGAAAGAAVAAAQSDQLTPQQKAGATAVAATTAAVLVAMIEKYKQDLEVQHQVDLEALMAKVEDATRLPPPTERDIRQAKMASTLYSMAKARDATNPADLAGFRELKDVVDAASRDLLVETLPGGKVRVRGDLPALVAASIRMDEIPLKLPPPGGGEEVDAYLDKYLTPELFRMAGLRMSSRERSFFQDLARSGEEEYTFDPTTEQGRVLLGGLRRMMKKATAFQEWAAVL